MSEKKTLNFERIDASELELVQGGRVDGSKGGTDVGGATSGGSAGYHFCLCVCACRVEHSIR